MLTSFRIIKLCFIYVTYMYITIINLFFLFLEDEYFQCKKCPKYFTSSLLLFQHEVSHVTSTHNSLKRRPYACSVCGKSFTRKDSLQTHFYLHTGEKPYSCSICQSSFASRASLKFHMKNHS